MIIENENVDIYWIAYNENKSIIHYGKNEVGQTTVSGQPLSYKSKKKKDWINKLIEFGIDTDSEFIADILK